MFEQATLRVPGRGHECLARVATTERLAGLDDALPLQVLPSISFRTSSGASASIHAGPTESRSVLPPQPGQPADSAGTAVSERGGV